MIGAEFSSYFSAKGRIPGEFLNFAVVVRFCLFGTNHGIDGSTNGSVTFAIDLNGGSLRTPSIRVPLKFDSVGVKRVAYARTPGICRWFR